jgi:hypothetical protein
MEDYKFFPFFIGLITAVLCFGSHISDQAARIRVKCGDEDFHFRNCENLFPLMKKKERASSHVTKRTGES